MVRWTAVTVLLLAALGAGWLALSSTTPRGLELRVFDNLLWAGDPVEARTVAHLDFGPALSRHRIVIPEGSTATFSGFVYAPRGGTYNFSVESSSDVWLRIGTKTVLCHKATLGEQPTPGSLRIHKGFHPIRVNLRHREGLPYLRVNWQLPSGYMNMEPVQPVFLYPALPGPEPAVPIPLRVGPVLLLLLALALAFGPRIVRFGRRLGNDAGLRARVAAGALLFVATVGVRSIDLNGAGETSDEWAYASAGRIYVANVAHGYMHSAYWNANEEHPPIGKYVYGLVSHLLATDSYTPLRFVSALLAGGTVVLTFSFAVRFLTPWIGGLAGLVLVLMPHFVAHGKVAALDSPSAFLFTLAVYLFVKALLSADHRGWRFLLAGFAASIAFCTKFSNVLIFAFMGVAHFASQWRNIRRRGEMELSIGFYVLPALPMVVLFAVWPWLWREPFGQLLVTLKHWDYPIREWFLGRLCQPPVYYFPVYFAVTTPVLLLVPFGAFFHMAWRRRSFVDLLILLWFLTPFLWTASVLKQDGVRYIYNMYPPMALMVAIGLDHMLRAVGALRKVAAVGVAAAYLGIQCWLVHPYYLDYYNEAVGGTKGVWERSWFEVGWWGEGQKPCFDHINANAEEGATFDTIGVVNHTVDALRPDLVYSTKDPDWLIRDYQTPAEVEQADYVEVFRVEVDAAPLAIVYLRKEMAGRAAKERRRGPVEPGQWWEAGP